MERKGCGLQLKSHIHTPNLKSKIWNQGEKDWVQEHYLVIVEKREESKVFGCVWKRNQREERKRESPPKKLPKNLFFLQNDGFGSIYNGIMTLWLSEALEWPSTTQGLPATSANISSSGFFQFNFGCIVELILVSLKSSRCLVSKTLKKLVSGGQIKSYGLKKFADALCTIFQIT